MSVCSCTSSSRPRACSSRTIEDIACPGPDDRRDHADGPWPTRRPPASSRLQLRQPLRHVPELERGPDAAEFQQLRLRLAAAFVCRRQRPGQQRHCELDAQVTDVAPPALVDVSATPCALPGAFLRLDTGDASTSGGEPASGPAERPFIQAERNARIASPPMSSTPSRIALGKKFAARNLISSEVSDSARAAVPKSVTPMSQ